MLYPACISCGSFAVPLWVRGSCCFFSKTTVNNTPIPPTVNCNISADVSADISPYTRSICILYSVDISADCRLTYQPRVSTNRGLYYTWSKLHEPVGRVQFGVLEKFTSAYLFQTTQEKSCDYLLKICMKTFWRWLSRRNTHISCNQGKNCVIQGTHLI